MEHQKSEALLIAEGLDTIADKLGAGYPNTLLVLQESATKLLRQHARIQELEAHITKLTTWKNEGELEIRAWDTMKEQERKIIELEKMLESIGAGGVSAQRVTQAADHIEQPLEMVAAPVVLPEPEAEVVECRGDCPFQDGTNNEISVHLPVGTKLYTDQQVRELLAKDIDPVNLDRLGKALTKLGHATWVSQEEAAADIPRWVNALTSCVLETPEAAPQPQADALDAQRYRWLIDYFISDRVDLDDAIVAAKTSEDIAKIIDAAIAAAKEM